MYTFRAIFFCLFLIFFLSRDAGADVRRETFESVLASVLQHQAGVTEVEARVAEIRAAGMAAKAYPNPEIAAEVRPYINAPSDLENEYEIAISQPLRISTFGLRRHLAELMDKSASLERSFMLLELSQDARLKYGKAWAVQEREKELMDALRRLEAINAKINSAGKSGIWPVSSLKLFEGQLARLAAEHGGALANKASTLSVLGQKAGRLIEHELSPLPLAVLQTDGSFISDDKLPFREKLRMNNMIAQTKADIARLDASPQLAPRVAFEHTADGEDRMIAGISIEVPIFDRNEASRSEGNAKALAAQSRTDYSSQSVFAAQVMQLYEGSNGSLRQAMLFQKEVVPALREALLSAERELDTGQGNPDRVLQSLLELVSGHERFLELWTKALSERIELSLLIGKEI